MARTASTAPGMHPPTLLGGGSVGPTGGWTRLENVPEAVITASSLTKKYKDFAAVDGISFEVAPGESFGLLGPNGAGKSTTMRMVGAVSTRTSGTLSILGLDPDEHGPEIRSQLGVVPQADNLDQELRVRDNLIVYGR